jgi:CRISPR-associated endoribonuclease Cas6
MLTSLVVELRAPEAVTLPGHVGRAAHALFLRLLAADSPERAEALHGGEGLKPFTCSSLVGGRRQGKLMAVRPEQPCFIRLTAFEAELAGWLASLPGRLPETVELDGQPFHVARATADPAGHAWAAHSTYPDLSGPHLLGRQTPEPRIELDFVSPTAFHSGGRTLPLPLPESVFGSLLDKWNAYAPIALPEETRRFAVECLALSRYRLSTQVVAFKEGGMQVGFVGQVRYAALNHDRYWLSVLHTLADFAFYAGVGYQTTTGMGQARRISDQVS